jgi:hypothetical protein
MSTRLTPEVVNADHLYAAIQAIIHSNGPKGTTDTEIKRQLGQRYPAVLRANRDELLRLGINAFIEKRNRPSAAA